MDSYQDVNAQDALACDQGQRIRKTPSEIEAERQVRVERAAHGQTGSGKLLHDPIEDDPATAANIAQARSTAFWYCPVFPTWRQNLGRLRAVWKLQAHLLEMERGILWFNVEQMNPPGTWFD